MIETGSRRAALSAAVLFGLLVANPLPAAPPAGGSEAERTAKSDEAWLQGFWLHKRTDQPGPDESTWRILKIDAKGGWTCAELWGTPEKPTKLEVYGRGKGAKLAAMQAETAKFYIAGASAKEKAKRAFSLILPVTDNSTLNLGAMVRGDDGSIEFHNFSSIHWTTRYVRAEADVRASLDKLLENAPTGVPKS